MLRVQLKISLLFLFPHLSSSIDMHWPLEVTRCVGSVVLQVRCKSSVSWVTMVGTFTSIDRTDLELPVVCCVLILDVFVDFDIRKLPEERENLREPLVDRLLVLCENIRIRGLRLKCTDVFIDPFILL